MEVDENRNLSYFLLGLGVGAAIGIMFAPKSGEETRGLIRSKASGGKDYVSRRSGELADVASEYVDRGRDVLNRQGQQLRAAVDAGRQAYRDSVTEAGETNPPVPDSGV